MIADSGNRLARRAAASKLMANPAGRIEKLLAENAQLQKTIFAILRTEGRVLVPKGITKALDEGDTMDCADDGDAWIFEYRAGS